jgi:hypothetical protein
LNIKHIRQIWQFATYTSSLRKPKKLCAAWYVTVETGLTIAADQLPGMNG